MVGIVAQPDLHDVIECDGNRIVVRLVEHLQFPVVAGTKFSFNASNWFIIVSGRTPRDRSVPDIVLSLYLNIFTAEIRGIAYKNRLDQAPTNIPLMATSPGT